MTTTLALPETTALITGALYTDSHLTSEHSREQYRSNLEAFEAWRAGQPLTKTLVEAYAAHLRREGYAPTTINHKLASIRWMARKFKDYALDYLPPQQGEQFAKQFERIQAVEDVKGTPAPTGRHLKKNELKRLLRTCVDDKSPAGVRDAALFAVAWTTGLRRDELCGLKLSDLYLNESTHEADLTVHGKGDKVRSAYLFNGALDALLEWIEVRGETPGPLFCHISKSSTVFPERGFSGEGLRKLFLRRLDQSKSKLATWHDFRRTFCGNLWDQGVDGASIQKLMGHSSITTTAGYDRRPEQTRRDAVRKLTVPFFEEK